MCVWCGSSARARDGAVVCVSCYAAVSSTPTATAASRVYTFLIFLPLLGFLHFLNPNTSLTPELLLIHRPAILFFFSFGEDRCRVNNSKMGTIISYPIQMINLMSMTLT
jgi:hypothetical protein